MFASDILLSSYINSALSFSITNNISADAPLSLIANGIFASNTSLSFAAGTISASNILSFFIVSDALLFLDVSSSLFFIAGDSFLFAITGNFSSLIIDGAGFLFIIFDGNYLFCVSFADSQALLQLGTLSYARCFLLPFLPTPLTYFAIPFTKNILFDELFITQKLIALIQQ